MVAAAEQSPLNLNTNGLARAVELIMCRGYTFGSFYKVTQEQLSALYRWGYELQKWRKFEKAERVFTYLCYLNHYDERAWIALGFCREQQREYQRALQAYFVAAQLEGDNPVPLLRSTECLMQQNNLTLARTMAQKAIEIAGNRTHLAARREKAAFLLKVIDKRLAKSKQQ